jgi:hypothetical protein
VCASLGGLKGYYILSVIRERRGTRRQSSEKYGVGSKLNTVMRRERNKAVERQKAEVGKPHVTFDTDLCFSQALFFRPTTRQQKCEQKKGKRLKRRKEFSLRHNTYKDALQLLECCKYVIEML